MAVGRVVKFDQVRGFGFITPARGEEDVFLHVNDLLMLESEVRPGITVEFDIDEGGRGLKASNIRLAEGVGIADLQSRPAPGPPASRSPAPGSLAAGSAAVQSPVAGTASVSAASAASAAVPGADPVPPSTAAAFTDNDLCAVLTPGEFAAQITELLLTGVPTITGAQVVEARRVLLEFSKDRGWVSL